MKRIGLFVICVLFSLACAAQEAKDIMIGVHGDLIKSDYTVFFRKVQVGLEANYFVTQAWTATAGVEFWIPGQVSMVVGGRWYANKDLFVRARGLIGANDISIGAGWTQPLDDRWHFEAMGDFYFEGFFAIRAGFTYIPRR